MTMEKSSTLEDQSETEGFCLKARDWLLKWKNCTDLRPLVFWLASISPTVSVSNCTSVSVEKLTHSVNSRFLYSLLSGYLHHCHVRSYNTISHTWNKVLLTECVVLRNTFICHLNSTTLLFTHSILLEMLRCFVRSLFSSGQYYKAQRLRGDY